MNQEPMQSIVPMHLSRPRSAQRAGFTLIELTVVLIIAGVLAGMVIPNFNKMQATRAAQNARDSFVWMGNRARALALETGRTQLLEIDPATERAWIVRMNATVPTDTLQTVNYSTEYKALVVTAANTKITVCFNPRGFAWNCAAGSPTSNVNVTFRAGPNSAVARIKVLGQIERI